MGAPMTFPQWGQARSAIGYDPLPVARDTTIPGGPAKPGRMRVGEHWRRDWQLRPGGQGGLGRLEGGFQVGAGAPLIRPPLAATFPHWGKVYCAPGGARKPCGLQGGLVGAP